mmetsp:Transcript_3476/g.5805  ORF Transcript_3476/g.5805 Transcript_3476/m.5805 type:complete len:273 (+) Transcript_3476:129-947(+)|eukprot:CAMPEP_0119012430 /NCGR_PEP_ID=MMETSP1176-20130426/6724_1 /TAXON_ID=265551 /ORGANISM="Synedropsis recta cf, Strain CCMP1620" /LENGTH=272 /DNA_ID=CAMNT_0006965389 /DNA_START=107 /DNA_END=925 /DNA_ORIENTATION=-
MADNWDDDDDDDWDKDSDDEGGDEALKARMSALGLGKQQDAPKFDDEEDLAVVERAKQDKAQTADLKKKGNALAAKKQAEQDRKDEEEIARKAMELEAEMEANMSPDELRVMKRKQAEEADHALTDDLFGGMDDHQASAVKSTAAAAGGGAGGPLVLKDLKDHLKHARKVSTVIKQHGKVHLAAAFLKEAIQECKDVLDDAAISDIIKTCNVIKNDMVQASKRKVKYQAQKSAKRDKTAEKKALALNKELYGDNDQFDDYDKYGEQYEDAFF